MNIPIRLSKNSREPIYHQIEKQLKILIASGHIQAGSPLPSIRRLAKDLQVSVITTRRAYQNLEQKGFIETVQGRGTFVKHIDDELKDEVKVTTVYQKFKKAIDIAFRYDYSQKQIEEVFFNILKTYKYDQGEDYE